MSLAASYHTTCNKPPCARRQYLWLLPYQSLEPAGTPRFVRKMPMHRKTGGALLHSYHLNSEEFDLHVADLLINAAAAPVECCQGTAAQPQKQSDKCLKPGLPDISALSLQLQQEWHPDNNALLGGKKVKPYSVFKATWSCPKCPAGCPHIWKTRVSQRTIGTKCPYCEGRKLCKHNSLATKAPRQVEYWNQDTNAKTPEQMLAGSKLRANWKCPTCNREWQAEIAKRVRNDNGCPRCSKRGLGRRTKHPTFKAANHELLLQWDYVRNSKDNIHPHNITLGSSKYVHWVCQKCPKGQLHRYTARARQRTTKHSSGCPYCAGKQACECNSLQAHYPVISSEWDFARNQLMSLQVLVKWSGGRTMCEAAGCNALLSAQKLGASQNNNLPSGRCACCCILTKCLSTD